MKDGVLSLEDYKLNIGLCSALSLVFEDLGPKIYKLVLQNNGITDSDYAELLRGAIKNPYITSFILRKNEFQEESKTELLKFFEDKSRPRIKELVIS